jgi:hypothetical protein
MSDDREEGPLSLLQEERLGQEVVPGRESFSPCPLQVLKLDAMI